MPKGYYSSYTKKLISLTTKKDTFIVSQLYSPKESDYKHGSDGFYDLCPLSIYSKNRNQFCPVFLPKSSKFRDRNLGQPVINFTSAQDTIYFTTSPDNKIYSFIFEPHKFKIKDLKTYEFDYSTGDSLISLERSNYMKDLYRLAAKNPYQSSITLFKKNILLSFSKGLTEEQYKTLYSPKLSEKERAEFYANKRMAFVEVFNLNQRSDHGHMALKENIESISLKITDSTYLLKPKTIYYVQENRIPFYVAKLK